METAGAFILVRVTWVPNTISVILIFPSPESEFNEFEQRLKSSKNRSQLSAGLNFETLNIILSGTNHI